MSVDKAATQLFTVSRRSRFRPATGAVPRNARRFTRPVFVAVRELKSSSR